ncbi:hypothetical protein DFS34DRAFT_332151 [Phlyctochytrium arcticum]|nr:hypothetical protein DFS34DRAFT_332151 [Phlyctochytrium arcticum]
MSRWWWWWWWWWGRVQDGRPRLDFDLPLFPRPLLGYQDIEAIHPQYSPPIPTPKNKVNTHLPKKNMHNNVPRWTRAGYSTGMPSQPMFSGVIGGMFLGSV